MQERLWYLKRCRLFEQLTSDQLSRLECRALNRKYDRGTPIYLPSDEADAVLLLAEGRVKLCHFTADGKQALLAFIEPGELFGELSLLGDPGRDEYAEAILPSRVILIPRDALEEILEKSPALCMGITRLIGLRRKRVEKRLKNLLFRSNRERLGSLLLELCDQYGKPDPNGILIDIRLSHQDLANIIGSTRESVTVLLGEFQSLGILELGRKKIVVRKQAMLLDGQMEKTPELLERTYPPLGEKIKTCCEPG